MTWFPDMGREAFVSGDHVRAVGWLHGDHPFEHGELSPEFIAKLKLLIRAERSYPEDDVFGVACAGYHTCEFCGNARGTANLGVPAGEALFVAPEMVLHYVDEHGYRPPDEFVAAVMASPLPGTPEYAAAVARFREIHQRQFDAMM